MRYREQSSATSTFFVVAASLVAASLVAASLVAASLVAASLVSASLVAASLVSASLVSASLVSTVKRSCVARTYREVSRVRTIGIQRIERPDGYIVETCGKNNASSRFTATPSLSTGFFDQGRKNR